MMGPSSYAISPFLKLFLLLLWHFCFFSSYDISVFSPLKMITEQNEDCRLGLGCEIALRVSERLSYSYKNCDCASED